MIASLRRHVVRRAVTGIATTMAGLAAFAAPAAAALPKPIDIDVPGLPAGTQPFSITTGPDNKLWFTVLGTNAVGSYDPFDDGDPLDLIAAPSAMEIVAGGPLGTLWFTGDTVNSIYCFQAKGANACPPGALAPVNGFREYQLGAGVEPVGIVAGADGNMWYADNDGVSPSIRCKQVQSACPNVAGDGAYALPADVTPFGLAYGPDGNIWFTGRDTLPAPQGVIGCLDVVGTVAGDRSCTSTVASAPSLFYGLSTQSPDDIEVGPDGHLWFTQAAIAPLGGGLIGRMSIDGKLTEFATQGRTLGIAAGPDGAMWFTQRGPDMIGRAIPNGGGMLEFPSSPLTNLFGIAAGPDGRVWFAGENATGGALGVVGGSTLSDPGPGTGNGPFGVGPLPAPPIFGGGKPGTPSEGFPRT